MPHKKKYDWKIIQADYDSGLTLRELRERHGVQMQALNKARVRGDLVTRNGSEALQKQVERHGRRLVTPMGQEARARLSIEQTIRNRGGRCRWFEVSGQRVQGTWERDLALKLDQSGIAWVKCAKSILYHMDGKDRRYTPDFYLPEFDLYVELKGFWWGDDRRKMAAVFQQHPDLRLIVVEKEDFVAALAA